MSLNTVIRAKPPKKPSFLSAVVSTIFGVIFGLILIVAGFAIAYDGFGRLAYQYLNSGNWQSVPAKIINLDLKAKTYKSKKSYRVDATYTYIFQGKSYQSNKVSLSTTTDNTGDYWQTLHRRLETDQSNDAVTALVNPNAPSESLLDRTFRWLPAIFGSIFIVVFSGLGFVIFWVSVKPNKYQPKVIYDSQKGLSSNEKSGFWIIFVFGSVLFLIGSITFLTAIPDIINKGEYGALVTLIFAFAGMMIIIFAVKRRNNYKIVGPTPLFLDPAPGAIGGQVGGQFIIDCVSLDKPLEITLTCQRKVKSGKNTTIKILWQKSIEAYSKRVIEGVEILFVFDCPADLPEDGEDRVSWVLEAQGDINKNSTSVKLTRNWSIPVFKDATNMQSKISVPTEFLEQQAQDNATAAKMNAESLLQLSQQDQYLHVESTAGRPVSGSLWGLIAGVIFGGSGIFTTSQDWWPGYVFIVFGVIMIIASVFILGRELEIKIDTLARILYMRRKWFGIRLYKRQVTLFNPSQFSIKSTSSTTNGKRQIKYYCVYIDHDGKKVVIAEGIKGEAVAEAAMNGIIEKAFPTRF